MCTKFDIYVFIITLPAWPFQRLLSVSCYFQQFLKLAVQKAYMNRKSYFHVLSSVLTKWRKKTFMCCLQVKGKLKKISMCCLQTLVNGEKNIHVLFSDLSKWKINIHVLSSDLRKWKAKHPYVFVRLK